MDGAQAHIAKKRLAIFKEERVGGRARVTTDEDRALGLGRGV